MDNLNLNVPEHLDEELRKFLIGLTQSVRQVEANSKTETELVRETTISDSEQINELLSKQENLEKVLKKVEERPSTWGKTCGYIEDDGSSAISIVTTSYTDLGNDGAGGNNIVMPITDSTVQEGFVSDSQGGWNCLLSKSVNARFKWEFSFSKNGPGTVLYYFQVFVNGVGVSSEIPISEVGNAVYIPMVITRNILVHPGDYVNVKLKEAGATNATIDGLVCTVHEANQLGT